MKTSAKRRDGMSAWLRKEGLPFAVMVLVLFSVRSSLADWNDVPSGSMRPTILEGDRIFVNKLAYDLKVPFTTWRVAEWANPRRGDIAVFYSPYDGKRLVKRVVGLPGDTIELRNNRLTINGQAVEYGPIPPEIASNLPTGERPQRLYTQEDLGEKAHVVAAIPSVPARRYFGPFQISEGKYFMMGDNRDDSFDSRYFGPVDRGQIVGRAQAVVLSLDRQHYWLPRFKRWFTSL